MWCVIVLLTFLSFSPLEGLNSNEGTENNQAILFTSGFSTTGAIGKVQSSGSNSITCDSPIRYIEIDNSGTLTLVKTLPRVATHFQCTVNGKTTVFIEVLASCFGNSFAHNIVEELNKEVRPDSDSNLHNSVSKHEMTPIELLRILRQIPDNDLTSMRSLVELKIEKCVEWTKQRIADDYRKRKSLSTDTVVHTLFHVRKLFSAQKLEHLRELLQAVKPRPVNCEGKTLYRTFNGECNNLNFQCQRFGAANTEFVRILPAKYFDVDGLNDPIGFPNQPNAPTVPSPFEISREFIKLDTTTNVVADQTHAVMQFGQFLDHDLDLTDNNEGGAQFCEESDACNQEDPALAFQAPCFPILANGQDDCINVVRSAATFEDYDYPRTRQQTNLITSYVDGSQIYGSSKERANELRDLTSKKGLLRVSSGPSGDLLPETSDQLEVPCLPINTQCFLAGDVRSNEQVSLNSFHTLFVREHNRIATELKKINDNWKGEKIYQETRKILGAVLQKIVYCDYLPLIIGRGKLQAYVRYDPSVNPGISNAFATAAYRFGHSAIRAEFDLLGPDFNAFDPASPSINIRFMFFNNTIIRREFGIEHILLGLVGNNSALVDRKLASGLVENLFERPESGSPALNLAALNIQRSRDHGLPSYNEFRKLCQLTDAKTFEDTAAEIQNEENRRILRDLYNDDPNLAELWVAGLAETPLPGATVGRTFSCIIAKQFQRTRDGDRFYFENGIFTRDQLRQIKIASLSRIYCDNVEGIVSMNKNAFKLGERINCGRIPGINFDFWKECPRGQRLNAAQQCVRSYRRWRYRRNYRRYRIYGK